MQDSGPTPISLFVTKLQQGRTRFEINGFSAEFSNVLTSQTLVSHENEPSSNLRSTCCTQNLSHILLAYFLVLWLNIGTRNALSRVFIKKVALNSPSVEGREIADVVPLRTGITLDPSAIFRGVVASLHRMNKRLRTLSS